jgi:serine/threonine protein kinase
MWSMGVITYICLCGNFPFDDENMNFDELDNPNFLFGDYSWKDVSDEGKVILMYFSLCKIFQENAHNLEKDSGIPRIYYPLPTLKFYSIFKVGSWY